MRGNDDDLYLGKWLICRLMRRQGYSETDIAKYMNTERTQHACLSTFFSQTSDEIENHITPS